MASQNLVHIVHATSRSPGEPASLATRHGRAVTPLSVLAAVAVPVWISLRSLTGASVVLGKNAEPSSGTRPCRNPRQRTCASHGKVECRCPKGSRVIFRAQCSNRVRVRPIALLSLRRSAGMFYARTECGERCCRISRRRTFSTAPNTVGVQKADLTKEKKNAKFQNLKQIRWPSGNLRVVKQCPSARRLLAPNTATVDTRRRWPTPRAHRKPSVARRSTESGILKRASAEILPAILESHNRHDY